MSKLTVRLIRHASGSHMLNPNLIAGRSLEALLTEHGETEADQKGLELAREGVVPTAIFSSPAQRCLQTAHRIIRVMGLNVGVEVASDLIEMDQGDYVGRVRNEVYDKRVQRQILEQGKDFALPGGESMNEVGHRGLRWLRAQEKLAMSATTDVTLLAFTHAGLITHTVGAIEIWDQPTSLRKLQSMPPVGETTVAFSDAEWHVQSFARPLEG